MHIASLQRRLVASAVRETPDLQGVLSLWDGAECVFVSHTPGNRSLRDCLRQHFALREQGVIRASHFSWEATATAKTREGEVLAQHLEKHGRLPRYNDDGSPLQATPSCVTDLRARA